MAEIVIPEPADGEMYPDPRTEGGWNIVIMHDEKKLLDKTVAMVPTTGNGDTVGY